MKEKLIEYLQSHSHKEISDINDDTSIFSSGLLSSLEVMEFITFLEQETGKEIPLEEVTIENFDTISAVMTFLQR